MPLLLDILSGVLLLAGSAFCIIGGIGILRFPDFFSRMHAGGCVDTLGATLVLGGLMLQAPDWLVAVKLFIVLVFIYVTSPTSTYAIARAALVHGCTPILDDDTWDEDYRDGPLAANRESEV